jgi:hypothetical protein
MANIIDNMFGSVNSMLGFIEHPFQSMLLFIGGILLMIIIYKILVA